MTVLEIFSNPYDQSIAIYGHEGKFGYAFSRGPEHNFKMEVTATAIFDSKDEAIKSLENLLDSIIKISTDELSDKKSFISSILLSEYDGEMPKPEMVLNKDIRDKILEDLKTKGVAHTFEYERKAA